MEKVGEWVRIGIAAMAFGVVFYVLAFGFPDSFGAQLFEFLMGSVSVAASSISFYAAGREYDRAFLEQKARAQARRIAWREEGNVWQVR